MSRMTTKSSMAIAIALALGSTQVVAQNVLEEVTVTAQKREENVQDVGIAVTAFTGDSADPTGLHQRTASDGPGPRC